MTVNGYTDQRRQHLEDTLTLLERGKFPLDRGELSRTVFGPEGRFRPDPRWIRVWGYFGELILPLWRFALAAPEGPAGDLRSFAGDEERAFFPWLDPYISAQPSADSRGGRLLESVVKSVDDAWRDWQEDGAAALLPDFELTPEELEASTRMLELVRHGMIGPIARASGIALAYDQSVLGVTSDDDAKKTWLALNTRLPRNPVPGMIFLARRLGRDLLPGAVFTKVDVDDDYLTALTDPAVGLPPLLAAKFINDEFLMGHKRRVEEHGYLDSGIHAPGTTELDRAGVAYLFSAKADTSLMVLAPTSSGKSRFGQIAITREVHEKKRQHRKAYGKVVVIVPTKALVTQFARELRDLLAGTEAQGWEVLEGSRDYPQNDDRIRASRFDIAVIIPEKLAALMRNGMKIERTPLVLVDELQHIADGQRGLKEEQLLMEIFGRPSPPRFIGLSASLDPATSELLQRWFASNLLRVDLLEVTARPVPLTVTTLDKDRRIESRTHIVGDRKDLEIALVGVSKIKDLVRGSTQLKTTANQYRVSLGLLLELLRESLSGGEFTESTPSVLVFVDTRRHAENLAKVTRELLVTALGVPPQITGRRGEVPLVRFPVFSAAADLPHPLDVVRLLPPGRIRADLTNALESGVGFHTASLNQAGRSVIETLFRRGFIRVLFATDTLRLGINLPADVVINADLHMYIGADGARLISKDALIQRLGRAGRLGHSRSLGQGFLVARRPPDYVRFEAHDRLEVTGREDASEEEVRDAVGTVEGLHRAYVHDWSGGAHYARPTDPTWFDQIVAQYLEANVGRTLPAEHLQQTLDALFARSLAGADGAERPDGARVVERLTMAGAIALAGDEYRLTDVGRSAAINALTTKDTQIVKRIAAAAREGAGPFTLIYLACTSWHVSTSTNQAAIRPGDGVEIVERVFSGLRNSATTSGLPRNRTTFMRHFPDSVPDMIGTGAEADELRRLIELAPQGTVSVDDATRVSAVWRGLHVYLRWTGLEFARMENLLQRDEERWRVDESALVTLSEGAAYIISAASDLLGMNPDTMHFRSLGFFSAEVELGMPALLAPFLYLNNRGMDRERILGMRAILKESDERWDGLAELFDIYVDKYQAIPRRNDPEWSQLPDDVIQSIRAELLNYDESRRGTAYRVIDDVGAMPVPGRPGRRVRDDLEQIARGEGIEVLYEILGAFALGAELNAEGDRVTVHFPRDSDHEAQSTVFIIPSRGILVDNAFVDDVVRGLPLSVNAMVVAVDGATHGVVNRGRFMQDPVAIIDPALLLELLARVHKRYSDDVDDDDDDEDVYGLFGVPTEQRLDVDGARQELRRLFLRNAPVLSRNDLENRLAYREIVVA